MFFVAVFNQNESGRDFDLARRFIETRGKSRRPRPMRSLKLCGPFATVEECIREERPGRYASAVLMFELICGDVHGGRVSIHHTDFREPTQEAA